MTTRTEAVRFAEGIILRSTDWQEVQNALANHEAFGPWLKDAEDDGASIIREAERNLGSRLPRHYSN